MQKAHATATIRTGNTEDSKFTKRSTDLKMLSRDAIPPNTKNDMAVNSATRPTSCDIISLLAIRMPDLTSSFISC